MHGSPSATSDENQAGHNPNVTVPRGRSQPGVSVVSRSMHSAARPASIEARPRVTASASGAYASRQRSVYPATHSASSKSPEGKIASQPQSPALAQTSSASGAQ
ncbi:MAG: hypothetical protein IPG04_20680 [Polyangiaceae bacterium]|nr:hypothetical protein [Polyangiaceae bacterium]